jgi:hypothetical protein
MIVPTVLTVKAATVPQITPIRTPRVLSPVHHSTPKPTNSVTTINTTMDNITVAPYLIEQLPEEARFVLGDIHYNAPNVRRECLRSTEERFLVTTERGAYPHTDDGVEVRRIFHKLRSVANENFNEHFKAIFEVCTGSSHQRTHKHPAIRFGGGVGLPTGSALPS